ncbi:AzlC family ABC transporter permease [Motiliproteus coralliicola]|uniref:AzlC family ABC transporter permease n=1 Tax=Motiliproteus coralliicola TaxID=2283196 RepID=UPI001A9FC7CB|nr:AzlC family ABC transporter permease [Motiliproteus coralliicola]
MEPNLNTDNPAASPEQRRQALLEGAQATIPLIVGAIPFGILFGTLAEPSGLSLWATLAMSWIVFAGSAQFIALGLLAGGAGVGVIVATTFVVNLRHLLYSAALVEQVRHLPQYWRVPMAFFLTDETFAAVSNRLLQTDKDSMQKAVAHWYYLGSALAMWGNWQLCTWLGIGLGEAFPDMTNWGLDFAMSVTFIGMVAPYLRSQKQGRTHWHTPMLICVVSAGLMALATWSLPHKLGLIAAAVTGICLGYSAHLWQQSRQEADA